MFQLLLGPPGPALHVSHGPRAQPPVDSVSATAGLGRTILAQQLYSLNSGLVLVVVVWEASRLVVGWVGVWVVFCSKVSPKLGFRLYFVLVASVAWLAAQQPT